MIWMYFLFYNRFSKVVLLLPNMLVQLMLQNNCIRKEALGAFIRELLPLC